MVKLFSKNSNLCDHNSPTLQTDRQTDRQTTCDRNTALCTKVHRAVKTAQCCSPDQTYMLINHQCHICTVVLQSPLPKLSFNKTKLYTTGAENKMTGLIRQLCWQPDNEQESHAYARTPCNTAVVGIRGKLVQNTEQTNSLHQKSDLYCCKVSILNELINTDQPTKA